MPARASFTENKPRKYRNTKSMGVGPDGKPCEYISSREASYSYALLARARAGEIASWEPQKRITLTINGKPLTPFLGKRDSVYVADFYVTLPDGSIELYEIKGYQNPGDPVTRLWRLKLGIIQVMHPEWKIVIA